MKRVEEGKGERKPGREERERGKERERVAVREPFLTCLSFHQIIDDAVSWILKHCKRAVTASK